MRTEVAWGACASASRRNGDQGRIWTQSRSEPLQKFDTILLRTIARNLAKYMASKSIEKAFEADDDDERLG